jgi:hypothetical protein
MDARGTLWLDAAEEDHEAWADFLGGVDLNFAAARRAAAAALRRLEGAAAAVAGLGMVFAPAGLAVAPEYRWGRVVVGRALERAPVCCCFPQDASLAAA